MLYKVHFDVEHADLAKIYDKFEDCNVLFAEGNLYFHTDKDKETVKKVLKKAKCIDNFILDITEHYKNESPFVVSWYNSCRILEPLPEIKQKQADEFYTCAIKVLEGIENGSIILQPKSDGGENL